ncbi:MAG TPA: glycosyltransferase [Rhizomicrobium sp.]|nr:glycosyltransferase [Rhizomicrobium sp.]
MPIPAVAHFCWIGPRLSWASVFALLSAAVRGELAEVVLHHTDVLQEGPELRALAQASGVRLSPIDPVDVLARAGQALGTGAGEALVEMYRRLESPVVRSDILRAAILLSQGGVYLDMDTVTTRSLRPLLDTPCFLGWEYVVWPFAARQRRTPALWIGQISLDVVRKLLRSAPGGWRAFRVVQGLYFRNVNNAVMGAEAGAPLLVAYLRAMLQVPPECQGLPYALGPDLLQAIIEAGPQAGLVIHRPDVFYPLPPEISQHWFRIGRLGSVETVLTADTRVVHWYASIRSRRLVARISPAYVQDNRRRQLYSCLVHSIIGHLSGIFPLTGHAPDRTIAASASASLATLP